MSVHPREALPKGAAPEQRKCLFCEADTNSPEHLWPKWMAPNFTRGAHDRRQHGYFRESKTREAIPQTWMPLHGHVTTSKFRHVCKTCNERWMSVLEVAARRYVEPMLFGRRVFLDQHAIQTVAAWITLKMMVFEAIDPSEAVFSREETLQFAQGQQIPTDVKIWLMRTEGPEPRAYITRAFASMSHEAEAEAVRANAQLSVFLAGRLCVAFAVNRVRPLKLNGPARSRAKLLWPARGPDMAWPPRQNVSDEELVKMSVALSDFARAWEARP